MQEKEPMQQLLTSLRVQIQPNLHVRNQWLPNRPLIMITLESWPKNGRLTILGPKLKDLDPNSKNSSRLMCLLKLKSSITTKCFLILSMKMISIWRGSREWSKSTDCKWGCRSGFRISNSSCVGSAYRHPLVVSLNGLRQSSHHELAFGIELNLGAISLQ